MLLTNNGKGGFSANTTNFASNGGALAVGDLNNDGKSDLVLVNPFSSILTVLLGDGSGGFQPSQISTAALVTSVALGDFDNDGTLDISAGGGGFPTPISILRGKGDGAFQPPSVIGFPAPAPGLIVGDFNHDNYLDVASLDSGNNNIVVLLGDGKGSLTTRTDITLPTLSDADPTAFGGVGSSAVADIDHDGKLDVVVLQYTQDMQGFNGLITVVPGNGDGTFRQAVTTPVANFGIGQMILSDFNGDGKIDVATAQDPTTGLISVVLGNGDDTFGAPVANPVSLPGVVIQDMVEGDFNKDGKGDLAAVVFVSANSTSQVYVFTSNGDGTFQPHLVDTLPTAAPSLAAADFNHDGNLDLVVIDEVGNPSVLIYLAKGDGTFSVGATYMTGTSFTNTVQAADFNGDGKVDITVGTESGLDFFAGNGDGTFQPFVKTATLTSITGSFLGDFNGDQKPDFAAGNGIVGISIGTGDGTFRTPSLFQIPYSPKGFASAGDLNADGSFDLAEFGAASPVGVTTQSLSVWHSVPTISFSTPRLDFATQSTGTTSSPASITLVNNGNAPLSISTITASGSFAQTSNCKSSIAIGQSCSVKVTFNPTSAGAANGRLTFSDNAYPNTQVLVLTGMGNSSDFSITASPSSNSVTAGATATYTATLAPIDGFSGTAQLACAGAPTKATCTLSKTSVTLDGSSSVDVTVTVTTTAPTTAFLITPSPLDNTFRPSPLWACIGFVPIAGLLLTRRRKLAAIAAFGVIAFTLVACGGGSNSGGGGGSTPGTPPGTYSLKISGTDGSLIHTSTITLTVK